MILCTSNDFRKGKPQISLFGTHLWKYFYASLAVVQIGSYFNSLWMKNEIVGFISEDQATKTLGENFNTSIGAKEGSFIIRFSEKGPGGLSFYFVTSGNFLIGFIFVDTIKSVLIFYFFFQWEGRSRYAD